MAPDADRLLAAHRHANAYYQAELGRTRAGPPLAYLRSRGIPPGLARSGPWRLGYAPPTRASLTEHLRARGFADEELVSAGLASVPSGGRQAGRTVDAFRNRLIFPIRRPDGAVVAFVGRDLSGNPRVPRYRNTKGTSIYTKSEHLYGLFEASLGMRAELEAILLVEGAADAVALGRLPTVQAREWAAVSPCGTAVTAAQVALLAASVPAGAAVVVCFDPDAPGQRAAARAYQLLGGWPGPVDAIALPSGTDPAALVAGRGPRQAERTLKAARQPLLAALVRHRIARHRLDEIEGRVTALRAAGRLLRRAADQTPRDAALLPKIGRDLGLQLGFDGVTVLESIYPHP
jgi:DNA primase catalytic core